MVRPEVTGGKPHTVADDADAFSIGEFCRRHGISPQLFENFRDERPTSFRIGTRVLISREAAVTWRRERERAA